MTPSQLSPRGIIPKREGARSSVALQVLPLGRI